MLCLPAGAKYPFFYEKERIMIYDFSVDYDAIAVDNILDIQKYLMKKNGIV